MLNLITVADITILAEALGFYRVIIRDGDYVSFADKESSTLYVIWEDNTMSKHVYLRVAHTTASLPQAKMIEKHITDARILMEEIEKILKV
jgi:hypothetical protein